MRTRETRVYTVEEAGKTELVIQAPWYQNGEFKGLVEFSVPLDGPISHIVRE